MVSGMRGTIQQNNESNKNPAENKIKVWRASKRPEYLINNYRMKVKYN